MGRITHVVDGETVEILVNDRRMRLRLAGIEAPPVTGKYMFGLRSRQSLLQVCGGEVAVFETRGTDREGRMLARVHCAGTDASAEQVRRGMASTSAQAGSELQAIEKAARAARRGVWSTQISTTADPQ